MNTAVAQLGVVEEVFLRPLTRQLRHTGYSLTLLLRVLYLLQHRLRGVGGLVQVIVQLALDEVVDKLINAYTVLAQRHIPRTEFNLRLRLERRLLHVDGYGTHYAVAYVGQVMILVEELFYRLSYSLTEGGLVSTALYGVLTVDEGEILFARLIGMRQRNLYILTGEMYDGVQRLGCHVLPEQVEQTVATDKAFAVVAQGETGVQI